MIRLYGLSDRYFDEVDFVRDGVGLKKFHLIGHSWGTVAVGFAAKHPDDILSFSLHSPILSFPCYSHRVARALKQNLSGFYGTAGQVIDDFELRGKGTKGAYDAACLEFTKKHITHTWPLPEAMKKLIAARNSAIHDVMVASDSELNVLGNLQTVNVTPQLSKLDFPILMTCGSDDLCTPAYTKWQSELANDPRYHIVEGSPT
ncbi:MAG: alpha/beta fold hydrolase [Halobacteriota archaeon]